MTQQKPSLLELDFLEWLEHPVTKALRARCLRNKALLMDQWASGKFTDVSQYTTAILNAEAIGKCQVYELIAQLEPEDIGETE